MDEPMVSGAGADSFAALVRPEQAHDALERDEVFEQVTVGLFGNKPAARRVGRYRLGERLGGGGQGVVYLAVDPKLQRQVAIKIFVASAQEAGTAIRREAQALAQLSHPNVIAINDVGTCPSGVFIVMQYVPGQTLLQWLDGPPTRRWSEVLDAFTAAGRGLAAAHQRGIVHRDFKPSNVWMGDDGVVRLLDFGLAQLGTCNASTSRLDELTSAADSLSLRQGVAGTPPYMAPEQHEGEASTPASDQYGFCVSLYEALYGRRPFHGPTMATLVSAKQRGIVPEPPPGSTVPRRLWQIVRRGLHPEPHQRWPTIGALVEALERAASSRPRRAFPLAVGLAVTALAGLAWMKPEGSACERHAELGDVWSDGRRNSIARAMGEVDVPFAVDTARRIDDAIDDYAARWSAARTSACERIGHDRTADRTLRCLTRLRGELDGRLSLLQAPGPDTVEHADELIAGLQQPRTCSAAKWEPGPRAQAAYQAVEQARALGVSGDVEGAVIAARAAAADASQIDDDSLRAEASLVLGRLLSATGVLDEAIDELERAYLWGLSEERDRIAFEAAIELVALFASRRQDPSRCETWVERAAAMVGRLQASDDPTVTGRLALARASHAFTSGDHAQAVDHARQAARLLEEAGDSRMVSATTTLSRALANRDQAQEARQAAERALMLAKRLRGPDHPLTVGPRMTLATMRSDEPREALALFEQNLRVVRAAYGEDDLRVAEVRRNIATLYSRTGRNADAAREYRAVLAAQRAQLPEGDSLIAQTLYNLTVPLRRMGQTEEATRLGRESLRIAESALGPDHPTTAIYAYGLGQSLMVSDPKAAQPLFVRAMSSVEERVGKRHVLYATFEASLGECYRLLGDLLRSEEALQHAVTTMKSVRGADPDYIGEALHQLALTKAARGRDEEALSDNLEAVDRLETVRGSTDPSLRPVLDAIAERYGALGRPADARRIRARIALLRDAEEAGR